MFRKRHKTKTLDNSYPMHDGIQFIHHNPNLFNIGDFLCSPRHYFRFEGAKEGATILGGGIFDPRKPIVKKYSLDPGKTVIWGAGFSQKLHQEKEFVAELPFVAWGYRDVMYIPEDKFVPCVSCFHEVSGRSALGNKVVVFLNDDPKITPHPVRFKIEESCAKLGYELLWNSTSESNLVKTFRSAEKIITNSFHGAYWGLLSGRKVKALAHSMKFVSLLASFDMDGEKSVRFYNKRNAEEVLENILDTKEQDFVGLVDSDESRKNFQEINLKFIQELRSKGFVSKVSIG